MSSEQAASSRESQLPLKIAVYTCITRGYDSLKIPLCVDSRFEYFCFTDTPEIVKPPWTFRAIDLKGFSAKDQNRYIKMHPHDFLPGYDITVYLDGNIQIVGDLYELITQMVNSSDDIFLYEHPKRKCIYSEGAACSHIAHEKLWRIAQQMRRYSLSGYPEGNGLFEANVILRKNSLRMQLLMDEWWKEYSIGAKRDQLSLPFISWHLGIPICSLGKSDIQFGKRYFLLYWRPQKQSLGLIATKLINRFIAYVISYRVLFRTRRTVIWE